MGEEQSLGMKWRSREAADELVRELGASGMSRKRFCEQRGLSLGTPDLYRKRHHLAEGGAKRERGLVRVKLSTDQAWCGRGFQLLLSGGLRVEVAAGFAARTLTSTVQLASR